MTRYLLLPLAFALFNTTSAQDDDLLKLLGEEDNGPDTNAAFKSTRVINDSLENTAHGVLDFQSVTGSSA